MNIMVYYWFETSWNYLYVAKVTENNKIAGFIFVRFYGRYWLQYIFRTNNSTYCISILFILNRPTLFHWYSVKLIYNDFFSTFLPICRHDEIGNKTLRPSFKLGIKGYRWIHSAQVPHCRLFWSSQKLTLHRKMDSIQLMVVARVWRRWKLFRIAHNLSQNGTNPRRRKSRVQLTSLLIQWYGHTTCHTRCHTHTAEPWRDKTKFIT